MYFFYFLDSRWLNLPVLPICNHLLFSEGSQINTFLSIKTKCSRFNKKCSCRQKSCKYKRSFINIIMVFKFRCYMWKIFFVIFSRTGFGNNFNNSDKVTKCYFFIVKYFLVLILYFFEVISYCLDKVRYQEPNLISQIKTSHFNKASTYFLSCRFGTFIYIISHDNEKCIP